jgi:hypothetical protein
MNVFNQLRSDNNLDSAQLDSIINLAFDKLTLMYKQFDLSYLEDGVYINNFEQCSEEETSGFEKEDIENNLTEELLKIANLLC